jgi:hypothetical protein
MNFLAKILLLTLVLFGGSSLAESQTANLTPPPKKSYKYDGKIVSSFDRDKNETVVLIQLMPIRDVEDPRPITEDTPANPRQQDRLGMTLFFAYPGQTLVTPKYVSIGFLYLALDPERYENHQLKAKIDGTWTELGKMDVLRTQEVIVRNAYKRYTRRALEMSIPYEQLLQLANARKVKMKLGGVEFDLAKDHLEAIRDLASRTVP